MSMTTEALIMLLGDRGLTILDAILHGAGNTDAIRFFSGLPLSCIETRIPAMIDLGLVKTSPLGYLIDKRGKDLLDAASISSLIVA